MRFKEEIDKMGELSISELKQLMVKISQFCDIWIDTPDGSHEAALHYEGYYEVINEIERRRAGK